MLRQRKIPQAKVQLSDGTLNGKQPTLAVEEEKRKKYVGESAREVTDTALAMNERTSGTTTEPSTVATGINKRANPY